MSLKDSLASLIGLAAELHAVGAVRPDHDTKFSMLRGGLDQALSLADDAEQAAIAPPAPGVSEFQALAAKVDSLAHTMEAVGLATDHTADQVEKVFNIINSIPAAQ
jgi:hypothetical protein